MTNTFDISELEDIRQRLIDIKPRVTENIKQAVNESLNHINKILREDQFIKYFRMDENIISEHTRPLIKKGLKIICSLCKNDKFDVVNDTTHICRVCGNQKDIFNINPTHKNTSGHINTTSRYTYKRRIHFKDCINQYQGKQNANISSSIFEAIREKIKLYNLNDGDSYSRVTKEHIYMFLKDVSNGKHYEDINLIYRTITGKNVDDIGYLEETLINDFNILTELYDKKFKHTNRIDRKSFINTQYVLFQLLRRHKHPCKVEDFNILKTIDRKSIHEEILSELFDELGWNFTSLF